ncbi:MAG: hypothetical protein HY302_08660 [Opitutae bacterium]|nr:hypothetical protein [Opitutae bacterium]
MDTNATPNSPEPRRLVLLPSDRLFVQTVPLDAAAEPGTQIELALEANAPFPLAQLYYGYLAAPDRGLALVFAAYRRRFVAGETETWTAAEAVLPALLALTGDAARGAEFVLHTDDRVLTGVAWDGKHPLPVMILTQAAAPPPEEARRAALVAELRGGTGLTQAPTRVLEGPITVEPDEQGGVVFKIAGTETVRLAAAAVATADVRDKGFLAEQQRLRRRDLRLWRIVLGAAAAAVLAAGCDLAALALGGWNARVRRAIDAATPQVQRIATAQTLATRIEEISSRQFLPFEMLGLLSEHRPRSIQFLRAATKGLHTLEIEAQTPSATDVGVYEATLRGLAGVGGLEIRDLRSREGLTSFQLAVTFKPAAVPVSGGAW